MAFVDRRASRSPTQDLCLTTTEYDVATRLHLPSATMQNAQTNARYANSLPSFKSISGIVTDQAHQHHVNTGFLPLTISSRSTMTFLRLPSMSSFAA